MKFRFLGIYLACIVGSLSVLPYASHMGLLPEVASYTQLVLAVVGQTAVLFALACYISYRVLPKTDLEPFKEACFVRDVLTPGVGCGALLGVALVCVDRALFAGSALSGLQAPAWTGLLASVYGAVNEEVLLRLFFFTLVYWLMGKVLSGRASKRSVRLWFSNIIAAFVFALGHLPAAYHLVEPSCFETARILLGNAIPGLVFGWLYWSRGIWSVMCAHFAMDLVLHAVRF